MQQTAKWGVFIWGGYVIVKSNRFFQKILIFNTKDLLSAQWKSCSSSLLKDKSFLEESIAHSCQV